MSPSTSIRRAHGTGTLYVQERANGQELWYGRWYLGGRRVNRRLGPKRRRGTGEGLNRTQAEAQLRQLMVCERPPVAGSIVSFASTAELMLGDLEVLGRKPTTLDNYRARADAGPAGVDGSPRLPDHPHLRRLRTRRGREWPRGCRFLQWISGAKRAVPLSCQAALVTTAGLLHREAELVETSDPQPGAFSRASKISIPGDEDDFLITELERGGKVDGVVAAQPQIFRISAGAHG